jgi:hypothetical protein
MRRDLAAIALRYRPAQATEGWIGNRKLRKFWSGFGTR